MNHLSDQSVIHLAPLLTKNSTLQQLNLRMNRQLEAESALALAHALRHNRALRTLNLHVRSSSLLATHCARSDSLLIARDNDRYRLVLSVTQAPQSLRHSSETTGRSRRSISAAPAPAMLLLRHSREHCRTTPRSPPSTCMYGGCPSLSRAAQLNNLL